MIFICVTHLTNTCTKIPVAGSVSVQVFTAEDVTDGDTVSALASTSGKNSLEIVFGEREDKQ